MKKTNVPLVTLAIFLTTFMTAIEGTIVSTAMPTIVSDLNGLEMMNWVVSIFLLMTAVSTPIYGKLADSLGRKPVFLFGIGLFVVGSALCGLSTSMLELIFFRVIQGLGSGAVQTVAITVIADMYPPAKRARMLGINSSFWGVASVIAPLLGGFIVQQLSWHWVFEINVPLGIIAFLLVLFCLKENKHAQSGRLDLAGTSTLVIFLLSMMLFFQQLEDANWLLLGVLMLVMLLSGFGFYQAEKRAEDPILSLQLLKNRNFLILNLINLLVFGLVIGFEFYLPTWMQGINGTSASIAGFVVTPSSLFWILGSFTCTWMVGKWGTKGTIKGMLCLLLAAEIALVIMPFKTPFWVFFLVGPFTGLAFGTITMQSLVESQLMVPSDEIGVATSFNTLMKYLGQTILVSFYGIVFNLMVSHGLSQHPNLNSGMMNKIVSAQKAATLPAELIPSLRQVLFGALKSVYVVGILLVLLSFGLLAGFKGQTKKQNIH